MFFVNFYKQTICAKIQGMTDNKTNAIPLWNLDTLFPSLESDEYKSYSAYCKESLANLSALLDSADDFTRKGNQNFDFAAWLASFLKEYERSSAMLGTLMRYAYIIYSTDTTNSAYLNNLSKTEDLYSDSQSLRRRFALVLASHQKYLEDFYNRFAEFKDYKFILDELIESTRHQMSAQEERLASDLQKTGGNAWARLQEQIISTLQDSKGRTFNTLRGLAASPDKAERKDAYQNELALLKANRVALAACLNNLKGETVFLNSRRNWPQAIDRALSFSRLSRASLDALIGALEDALPIWRTYFKAKAALLRKAGATVSSAQEGLAFYDLFAPLPDMDSSTVAGAGAEQSLFEKEWTFQEAKDYVIKEYDSFSKEMGDFARNAFSSGWIDAQIRAGKVGGAYDEDFAKGHQSRILCNFSGRFTDVITMAHELGHAFHFSCMKGKSPLFFDYPMTLAETASTFAETLVKQDMIAHASAADRAKIIELDLQDVAQVLVDILCRFYFERSVFKERQNGELSADDFCRLMRDAQQQSYGDGLCGERHEYMWAVKSHYYSTDLDFYNFPYAFGQLFAAALYEKSRKEGAGFVQSYITLLSHTGSMSCEDLCKEAGFDITSKAFWQQGIELYRQEVQEFVSLV